MTVEYYNPAMASLWDETVPLTRNGTFLHLRSYMDYHSDRFADRSMVARDDVGKVVALLPAHADGTTLCSHRGLSYGGWLMTRRADALAMLDIWAKASHLAAAEGFDTLIYKPSPHIYHRYPAEEDLYALFRGGASVESVLISSVVDNNAPLGFDMASRQSVRKAARRGIVAARSDDWQGFWLVLSELLASRYGAKPVHTLDEITMLASRFPDNIALYTATLEGRIVAGVVMYVSDTVAHSQYAAATDEGKTLRALPLLYDYIMGQYAGKVRWFDFGTSNEDGGRVLNEGLIRQKCGFGARAVVYTTYRMSLV